MPRFGPELTLSTQAAMVQHLAVALQARVIETHLSFVLVGAAHALKLKKATKTAFADQSTRELRRWGCEEELRLNRRLAPDLYEAVVAITGSASSPVIGGSGAVIDHAVRMRSFSQDDLWSHRASQGSLAASDIDSLVAQLVPFHARADVVDLASTLGTAESMRDTVRRNIDELAAASAGNAAALAALEALRDWEARAFASAGPRLERRRARGRVRECHGDLHLGNVTSFEGRTTVFDGIEFAPPLRWMDVVGDIAFMAMDLQAHGDTRLAHRFVNACLEAGDDHDGLPVLNYQRVHRALVRAKVASLRAAQIGGPARMAEEVQAQRYIATAQALAAAPRPQLWFTHGCSGSGKSTFTQQLLERTGAVRLRSDVERRRLPVAEPGDRYGAAMNEATYDRLRELARGVLLDGHPVIVDATFLRRADRDGMRQVAAALGVPCTLIDFVSGADLALMRQRLRERAARGDDASEADEHVLETQLRRLEPLGPDELALAVAGWPQVVGGAE